MATNDSTTRIPKRMSNRERALPPSAELLAEATRLFSYNAVNGGLIWRCPANKQHPGKTKIGKMVGGDDGHGYLMCALLGHKFKVHQIVWLICKGALPELPIDHVNRDRRDNRIENMRLATDEQNIHNQKSNARKLSGVTKDTRGCGFAARIQHKGKKFYLGYFKTKEDANAAYVKASREIRGEYSAC